MAIFVAVMNISGHVFWIDIIQSKELLLFFTVTTLISQSVLLILIKNYLLLKIGLDVYKRQFPDKSKNRRHISRRRPCQLIFNMDLFSLTFPCCIAIMHSLKLTCNRRTLSQNTHGETV